MAAAVFGPWYAASAKIHLMKGKNRRVRRLRTQSAVAILHSSGVDDDVQQQAEAQHRMPRPLRRDEHVVGKTRSGNEKTVRVAGGDLAKHIVHRARKGCLLPGKLTPVAVKS